MSDVDHQPPPDPVLRFRMRTMLAVTAIIGVAAAVVGSLLRHVSPASQTALLTEWAVTLAFVAIFSGRRWQLYVRAVRDAGPVLFILRQRRSWTNELSRLPILWALLALSLMHAYWQSIERAIAGRSFGPMEAFFRSLLTAPLLCVACYCILSRLLSGRPVRLCEHGLRAAGEFKDWRLVSIVQPDFGDDPAMLISTWTERRRYELLTLPEQQAEVEALLRLKTHYVDDAALPPA